MELDKTKILNDCIKRLKIERDAILRCADNARIDYDRQITQLLDKRSELVFGK